MASEALFTNDSQLAEHRERLEATPPGAAPLDFGPITPPIALLAPAKGPITHGFGEALTGGGESTGIIIAAEKGFSVTAPDAGLVQYVGPVKGWGVILILRLPVATIWSWLDWTELPWVSDNRSRPERLSGG